MTDSELHITPTSVSWNGQAYRCAIGRGGLSAHKCEGDGTTPLGRFALRELLYRADRLKLPPTQLPSRAIRPTDSWCDIPTHPHYNRLIEVAENDTEHAAEHLWRNDHIYDLIIPIGYNDDPPIAAKGSAVFIHLARPGYPPTAGCIALDRADLLQLLPQLGSATICRISADPAGA